MLGLKDQTLDQKNSEIEDLDKRLNEMTNQMASLEA